MLRKTFSVKRVKTYSYLLLLANIVLLAHSFVPHTHNHELTIYEIEQIAGKNVVSCQCSSCTTFVKILENITSQNGNTEDCNCCKHGKSNCFISVGYYTQDHENFNLAQYYIAPQSIDIPKPENVVEYTYAERVITVPNTPPIAGLSTRAPPILFS